MKSVVVRQISPESPGVQKLIDGLDEYHEKLYPSESNHLDPVDVLMNKNVCFAAVYHHDSLAGIGAVKKRDNSYGEIKRVYVDPAYRGKKLSEAMMVFLENHLLENGIYEVKLETGIHQKEAISLYKKLGYQVIPHFGSYGPDPLSVFMGKNLSLDDNRIGL